MAPGTAASWYDGPGLWLKGNVHTHTTASDGALAPEETARRYAALGYDFLAFADHWKRTLPAGKPKGLVMIPAQEIDFRVGRLLYHMVALGARRELPWRRFPSVTAAAAYASDAGALPILSHPYWSGNTSAELLRASGLAGVEIYNNIARRLIGKGFSVVHWDNLLDGGMRVLGFAVDDTHGEEDIGRGWLVAKCRARTPAAILRAVAAGHFYTSIGPSIRSVAFDRAKRTVSVECSPCRFVRFIGNRWAGKTVEASGRRGLERASWTFDPWWSGDGCGCIRRESAYVRVECEDGEGRVAWSNPVWVG